jgi:hypothetical protein
MTLAVLEYPTSYATHQGLLATIRNIGSLTPAYPLPPSAHRTLRCILGKIAIEAHADTLTPHGQAATFRLAPKIHSSVTTANSSGRYSPSLLRHRIPLPRISPCSDGSIGSILGFLG